MELIPLALSFLAFIICLIWAIVYAIRQKDRGKRVTGVILAFSSVMLLFPFVPVLPRMNITRSNLAGTYEGLVGGSQWRLELHSDGTFKQQIISGDGRTSIQHGKWNVTNSTWGEIELNNIGTTNVVAGEAELDSMSLEVRGYDGALMFDDDTDEHLSRVHS